MPDPETAVRTYLFALKDPSSLVDEQAIEDATKVLQDEDDPIQRLRLQQRLAELQAPSLDVAEEGFVVHAKAWADDVGISSKAFLAEGVPSATLRRAGFSVKDGRGSRGGRARAPRRQTASSSRVRTEDVIEQMPTTAFTAKGLGELTGASPNVVRKAITQEVEAGQLTEAGTDPDHSGPGRAPMLYRR